jgi:hypothetical protein
MQDDVCEPAHQVHAEEVCCVEESTMECVGCVYAYRCGCIKHSRAVVGAGMAPAALLHGWALPRHAAPVVLRSAALSSAAHQHMASPLRTGPIMCVAASFTNYSTAWKLCCCAPFLHNVFCTSTRCSSTELVALMGACAEAPPAYMKNTQKMSLDIKLQNKK